MNTEELVRDSYKEVIKSKDKFIVEEYNKSKKMGKDLNKSYEEITKLIGRIKTGDDVISKLNEFVGDICELNYNLGRLNRKLSDKLEKARKKNNPERSYKPKPGSHQLPIEYAYNVTNQIDSSTPIIIDMIKKRHTELPLNLNQFVKVEMDRIGEEESLLLSKTILVRSGTDAVVSWDNIEKSVNRNSSRLNLSVAEEAKEGIWVVSRVLLHVFKLSEAEKAEQVEQAGGGVKECRGSFLPLPKAICHSRKGLVNMQNYKDDKCFLWSHVRRLKNDRNPGRISDTDVEFAKTLDYEGIEFPVKLEDVPTIEFRNDISINVYLYDEENDLVKPAYVSPLDRDRVLNLLILSKDGKTHYVLIRSIVSLMYKYSDRKGIKFVCYKCLAGFFSMSALCKHGLTCTGAEVIARNEPASIKTEV